MKRKVTDADHESLKSMIVRLKIAESIMGIEGPSTPGTIAAVYEYLWDGVSKQEFARRLQEPEAEDKFTNPQGDKGIDGLKLVKLINAADMMKQVIKDLMKEHKEKEK